MEMSIQGGLRASGPKLLAPDSPDQAFNEEFQESVIGKWQGFASNPPHDAMMGLPPPRPPSQTPPLGEHIPIYCSVEVRSRVHLLVGSHPRHGPIGGLKWTFPTSGPIFHGGDSGIGPKLAQISQLRDDPIIAASDWQNDAFLPFFSIWDA